MFGGKAKEEKAKEKPPKASGKRPKLPKRPKEHTTSYGSPSPPTNLAPYMPVNATGCAPVQHQYAPTPPHAAFTSNIPKQPTGPALWNEHSIIKPTADVTKTLTGQTSNLYHAPDGQSHQLCDASVDAANAIFDDSINRALYVSLSSKLDSIITSIDGDAFSGQEKDLVLSEEPNASLRGGGLFSNNTSASKGANKAISSTLISTNYFAKANVYANSKLRLDLPALQLYLPSYPLLCLAAQYSMRAYAKASNSEHEAFINADWRLGTKAMVLKSVPIDHMDCVVFAIRGSQTFMDWAVNLHSSPESPVNFLDDPGNLCHSGFLSVARKMIKPVATRLRQLVEENPSRSTCSLLMTGHSAGGAVASLLYAHMLAETARSELNNLTGCFKRIHCLTFGTPPISLLPLTKPRNEKTRKSLFMSFINEGDPVPRADPAYVRSLLRLYASPIPSALPSLPDKRTVGKRPAKSKHSASAPLGPTSKDLIWEVPPGTLSNAGRLVILRGEGGQDAVRGEEDDVKAQITSDQDLRGVVFGNPIMHMMKVYSRRIEVLATKAVTGRLMT